MSNLPSTRHRGAVCPAVRTQPTPSKHIVSKLLVIAKGIVISYSFALQVYQKQSGKEKFVDSHSFVRVLGL